MDVEHRKPDYEDEKLRRWDVQPEELPEERDPTILDVDFQHEEIYESRVYRFTDQLRFALLGDLAVEDGQDFTPETLGLFLGELDNSGFRILAKRNKKDGSITWKRVTNIGQKRDLIEESQGSENDFRTFVDGFETESTEAGDVHPPAVITPEEWRELQAQREKPSE